MQVVITEGFSKIETQGSVVTIGNFDGVHKGHAELIGYAVEEAKKNSLDSVVIVFKKRAVDILNNNPPLRLFPFEDSLSFIKKIKPTHIITVDFSDKISKMGADEFFKMLIDYYQVREIVEGADFRFGAKTQGDTQYLRTLASTESVRVRIFPFLTYLNAKISTSSIREHVLNGDVLHAAEMLGRYFTYSGVVEKGKGIGRQIGYPTANIPIKHGVVIPKEGVYITRAEVSEEGVFDSLTFIGKPEMQSEKRVETHLLACDENLYGKNVTLSFLDFLRDARKVESLDALKALIKSDIAVAKKRLSQF